MVPLVSVAHMRHLEAQTIAAGVASSTLVQRAGAAIAASIVQEFPLLRRVLVCVGPGNNGADGIVVACTLAHAGYAVQIVTWRRTHDSWLQTAHDAHIPVIPSDAYDSVRACADVDIIVDALLGIGNNRPIADDLVPLVRAINARPVPVVCIAVDVPTGCIGDSGATSVDVVHADITYATGPRKLGTCFLPALHAAGTVRAVDIGLVSVTTPTRLATPATVAPWLPPRPWDAYKGTFGTLCVWAGSAAYPGAAVLATTAALRSGAGIVSVATTTSLVPLVWQAPELTLTLLDSHPLTALCDARHSAFVIGPGLGRSTETEALLTTLLNPLHLGQRSVVLDADALTLLSRNPHWYQHIPTQQAVLTPHRGELRRLYGAELPDVPPVEFAAMLAQRWQQVLVMKGSTTVIAAPTGETMIWAQPNPVLATGGSGDVLAGVIGALLAQGAVPFQAAVLGVVIQGMAAHQLAHQRGNTGILPSDVIARLPEVIAALRAQPTDEVSDAHL